MSKARWIATSVGLLLSAVSSAGATVYLEHDFRTPESGGQVTASQSSATTQFIMLNNVVLTEDASGPLAREEKIMTGVLSVPRASNADTSGIRSVATSGVNQRYESFTAGAGFAPSTMVMVFRPDFTGPSTVTRMLFAHSEFNFSRSVNWQITSANQLFVQTGANASNARAVMAAPNWDPDTWYMLIASWNPGALVHVYYRPIGDGTVGAVASSTGVVPVTNNFVLPVYIGQNSDSSGNAFGSAAGGDFAYFLWTSDYTSTLAGFDAIYNTLIPEPGTAALMLIGAGLVLNRRRRGLVAFGG